MGKKQVTLESYQLLELAWSADGGDYLYAAGDTQLVLVNRKDGFSQSFAPTITHEREISAVKVLSPNCLITAGLDKCIKIWYTPKSDLNDATLMHKIKVD